ncbi:MAG: hypothetical protein QCI00_08490 [Candidatus Thermoplasmatota archaeon]|nr:hypothetical protein [Candidatus Thermoplasmatota archaeon]
METYIDLYLNVDCERASVIHNRLIQLGLKPTIGENDYVYKWEGIVSVEEELLFIENIQSALKGTGAILKFRSKR